MNKYYNSVNYLIVFVVFFFLLLHLNVKNIIKNEQVQISVYLQCTSTAGVISASETVACDSRYSFTLAAITTVPLQELQHLPDSETGEGL